MATHANLQFWNGTELVKHQFRPENCLESLVKNVFQIGSNLTIYLKNAVSQDLEFADGTGKFNITGGATYVLVVLPSAPPQVDHTYGFGTQPTTLAHRLPRPNISIGAGNPMPFRTRQLALPTLVPARRAISAAPQSPTSLPVTVYFYLGKWSSEGKFIVIDPPVSCPVALYEDDVVVLERITSKLNVELKKMDEVGPYLADSYDIYLQDKTKLVDHFDIRTLEFWKSYSKKKKFYAMPRVVRRFNFDDDSDSDDGRPASGKRTKQSGSKIAKKLATNITSNVERLMSKLKKEETLRGLYSNLKNQFTCSLCQQVIGGRPVVCVKCKVIVGCESCHNEYKSKEIRDNNPEDELATNIVMKSVDEWRCPFCRQVHDPWSSGEPFMPINCGDFLQTLAGVQNFMDSEQDEIH